jgi:uncharacterized membrane protein
MSPRVDRLWCRRCHRSAPRMTEPRPSAGAPARVRVPRSLHEFVAVPVLVVGVMLALAFASIYGDQAHGPMLTTVRGDLSHLIGKQASSATLGAVATGLVTVTSITFSVLLLAVQQTASNLSPVVFDQFVRRRTNQVFLGLFVGLALYAYVVLAAVQQRTPPIIGAFLATVLTVVALGCLLFLVYSTIDQMRPRNVMRQLHDRAVRAHDRETSLIMRSRRTSVSRLPVLAQYRSRTFGYVESIDLHVLDDRRDNHDGTGIDIAHQPEIEFHVSLGAEVAFGDLVASVKAPDVETAEQIRDRVDKAVAFSPAPDLDFDATTGVRDLGNIGWTSGSTSKQNPAIAAQSLHAIRDLAVRWTTEGERTGPDAVAVVYAHDDVDTVLNDPPRPGGDATAAGSDAGLARPLRRPSPRGHRCACRHLGRPRRRRARSMAQGSTGGPGAVTVSTLARAATNKGGLWC